MACWACCLWMSVLLTSALAPPPARYQSPSAFEGFQLLSLKPTTQAKVEHVKRLRKTYFELDFWKPPGAPGGSVVLIPPYLVSRVKQEADDVGIPWTILSSDVDSLIDTESEVSVKRESRDVRQVSLNVDINHLIYKKHDQLQADFRRLQAGYPSLIQLEPLPHLTHEDRQVMAVKVSGNKNSSSERLLLHGMSFAQRLSHLVFENIHKWFGNVVKALNSTEEGKGVIIIEGGIHAREWISPAAILYAIHTLVEGYTMGQAEAVFMLDFLEWYFIPVANPDGYIFSHAKKMNRFWRKNRRKITNHCFGVDLNRNFDFHFGTDGVSDDECSEIYHGHQPFSEPESRNIRDLFDKLKSQIVGYLAVHSFGQLILVPWCSMQPDSHPNNTDKLSKTAEAMSEAIVGLQNKTYLAGTLYDVLKDSVSGTSIDWVLIQKPEILSFGLELRPNLQSAQTFLLPPSEIRGAGLDLLTAMTVLAQSLI